MKRVRSHSAWTLGAQHLLTGLLLAAALALAGCGGSSMNPSTAVSPPTSTKQTPCTSGCGTALVSLTDAPGDFVSYIVTVDSLTLTRSNGSVVQTVPTTSQVDFSQLVNLSEVLSAQQLPPGNYTSAQLTLDYSNADIVVSTATGNVTVPTANLINGATGSAISGPITVTLSFGNTPLVITDGTVSNLAIDFNLAASNTVDLTASPPTVTVNPVLSASLAPASSKQIHVRGPLMSVSAGNSDYVVNVRPFADDQDEFGQFTVYTNASTTFLINGTSYTGSAGLSALAGVSAGTLTTAYGTWDTTTNTFTASVVHAGTSVAGVSGDAVTGTASVIKAIASGRKAAVAVDKFLGGNGRIDRRLAAQAEPETVLGPCEEFAGLERVAEVCLLPEERLAGFCELVQGMEEDDAGCESARCLQCDLRLKIKEVKFWGNY
jgi:hypothetical protein